MIHREVHLLYAIGLPLRHTNAYILSLIHIYIGSIRVVVNGPGAAGTAIIRMLLDSGVRDIIACDENDILYRERGVGIKDHKEMLCSITNLSGMRGTLADAVNGADVFIGVSVGGALTQLSLIHI